MNNRILIVDDDDDFRSLLSDLYLQADYQVKSVGNPLEALKLLSEENFSLCVTDQSMPELKGIDFIDKCRSMKPNMPIIMVSAYLSEEITTRLRNQRVEVFHKPLNIMSLLRKTSELIKNANTGIQSAPPQPKDVISDRGETTTQSQTPASKTQLTSFAFKSDAAKRLKKEIESIGDEIPNMVLVGDEGTHFAKICKDVETQTNADTHCFLYFSNKKINVFDISKAITDIPDSKVLVLVLIEAQQMGVAQKQALMKLHKRTGPFSDIRNPVKFIFCLNEDLDTLFAKGAIDQDFYLIMGQKEIYVPRLDLCKEDIPELAKEIALDLIKNNRVSETFGGFNSEASELLIKSEWEHNYNSLEATLAKALKLARGSTVTKDHLEKAIASPDVISPIDLPITEASTTSKRTPTVIEKIQTAPLQTKPETKTTTTGHTNREASNQRKTKSKNETPMIQCFTMLEDETELAKSILSEILLK